MREKIARAIVASKASVAASACSRAKIRACASASPSSIAWSVICAATRRAFWTPLPKRGAAAPIWWSRPELSLCGYPPEDLLLRPAFLAACAEELDAPGRASRGPVVLVGFPEAVAGKRHNALAVLRDGRVAAVYRKHELPNYTVFDEQRYFEPGTDACIIDVAGRARRAW